MTRTRTPVVIGVVTSLATVAALALGATLHADGPTAGPATALEAGHPATVSGDDATFGAGLADAIFDASSTMSGTRALVGALDDPSPWVLVHDRFPDGSPDDHGLLFVTDAGDLVLLGGDEVFAPMFVSIDPHEMLDVLGLGGDELYPVLDVGADCQGDSMSVLCLAIDSPTGVLYAAPGVYVEEISYRFMPSETEGMADGLTMDPDAEYFPSQTEGMNDGLTMDPDAEFFPSQTEGVGNDLTADPDAEFYPSETEGVGSDLTADPDAEFFPSETEGMGNDLTADPDAEFFPSETEGMGSDLAGNDNEWRAVPSPALLRDLVDLLWFMDQTNPESELTAMLDDALGWYVPDMDSDSSAMARSDLAAGVVTVLRSDPDLLDLAVGLGRSQLDGHYDYPDFLDIQLAPGSSTVTERLGAVLGMVSDAHELALVLDDWLRTPGRDFKVEIEGVTQAAWSWAAAPLVQPRMFDEADALFGKRTGLRGRDLADRVEQILVHLDGPDTPAGGLDALAGRLRIAIDHVGAGLSPDDAAPTVAEAVAGDADELDRDEVTPVGDGDRTTSTTSTEPGRTTEPVRTTEPATEPTTEPERPTTTVRPTSTTSPERTTTTVPERTTTTTRPTTTTEPERTTTTTRPTTTTEPERTTTTTRPTTTTEPERTTTTVSR